MNKKVLVSVLTIGVVAIAAIGGTIAYFSDKEVSANNIIVAGDIDLKVDHTKQSYNGMDCKTCDVTIVSDISNMVVARSVEPGFTPKSAVLVSNPDVRWTADVGNDNAKWIWATDPTLAEDTTNNVVYTFEKKFDWYGPYTATILSFAVSSDNSVEVWFNGFKVAEGTYETVYQTPITVPNLNVKQGENILQFKVKNWSGSTNPAENPGGLKYAFNIDGQCGDDYFKNNCTLFREKDLTQNDHFWMFDDIKPGDYGTNLISLHVKSNDSWACGYIKSIDDKENALIQPEIVDGDTSSDKGELSQLIQMVSWVDDGDGIHQPAEQITYNGAFGSASSIALFDSAGGSVIPGNTIKYIGIFWCTGSTITMNPDGSFRCDGAGINNTAQTDSFTADLELEAIQARNNAEYVCPGSVRPK